MENKLSQSEFEFLKSKGFILDEKKNSGFPYIESDGKTQVLVPQEKGFKLEFFEWVYDGDGCHYEDFDKEYSKEGQSLEDFINEWI
jgi:hypothetical protein